MMDLKKNEAVETKADCKDAAATEAESAQEVACASTTPTAEERPMPKDGEFDWTVQYCDEFYEQYIENFQQNKKSIIVTFYKIMLFITIFYLQPSLYKRLHKLNFVDQN